MSEERKNIFVPSTTVEIPSFIRFIHGNNQGVDDIYIFYTTKYNKIQGVMSKLTPINYVYNSHYLLLKVVILFYLLCVFVCVI